MADDPWRHSVRQSVTRAWTGYRITAITAPDTGLPDVSVNDVLVTGDTNVTIRFAGVLPAKVPVLANISPTSMAATSPGFTMVVT